MTTMSALRRRIEVKQDFQVRIEADRRRFHLGFNRKSLRGGRQDDRLNADLTPPLGALGQADFQGEAIRLAGLKLLEVEKHLFGLGVE